MFGYNIPVSDNYPLTEALLTLINEMRDEISSVLINNEASVHTRIPHSRVLQIYAKIRAYMRKADETPTGKRLYLVWFMVFLLVMF